MHTRQIRKSQDVATNALFSEFLVERLLDARKTAICWAEGGKVFVKSDAEDQVWADAVKEAEVPFTAFLRVTKPQLELVA